MPSFAGVSLGDTPAAVIAERGDPLQIRDNGGGEVRFAYLAPSGGAFEVVQFDGGVVSMVTVFAAHIPIL